MRTSLRHVRRSSLRSIAMTLALPLWLCNAAAGLATTYGQEANLSLSRDTATTEDPLVAIVTGVAFCPHVGAPQIGDGVVEIAYGDGCGILPPPLHEFAIYRLLEPLSPGIWEIRLLGPSVGSEPRPILDQAMVTVTDPRFSVQLSPSPSTEDENVVAQVEGSAFCPFVTSEIGTATIRIEIAEGICDPPSPFQPFQLNESLGQLPAGEYLVELFYVDQRVGENVLTVLPAGACTPNDTTLCLNDGRFKVEVGWNTGLSGPSGQGKAVEETVDTGFFWFFNPENIELVVKVLDACDTEFESYWVFAGGLTDVGVVIDVTDTQSGESVRYETLVGQPFDTITDTAALATCP
ncbi:MAG: hypothetical protein AAF657_31880 [Acidobacteriota bacterium]